MSRTAPLALLLMALTVGGIGCQHPSVSAVSLNPHYCDHKFAFLYDPCKEPEGIPFYLPKPLLIISKNFRNIEDAKVGLTDTAPIPNYYDDQAKYADLNARTNFQGLDGNAATGTQAASPDQKFPDKDASNLATKSGQHIYSTGGAPVTPGAVTPDGLKPEAFFTYHVIFVPDLTQKYGLKIKGGAGEIRAAMNLVNGWQFTGLGPYYMKDSSTAQNVLAGGISANLAASGVADVVKSVASLKPGGGAAAPGGRNQSSVPISASQLQALSDALRQLNPKFLTIPAYAEISIYEPYLSPEGTMEWKVIAEKCFDRNVVATDFSPSDVLSLLRDGVPSASASAAPAAAPAATVRTPMGVVPPGGARPAAGGPPAAVGTGPLNAPRVTTPPTGPTTPPAIPPPAQEDAGAPRDVPRPPDPGETATPSEALPLTKPAATGSPRDSGLSRSGGPGGAAGLPPLPADPGASRVPPVQGPRASLGAGSPMRLSSIRSAAVDPAKADDAVVQTQGPATAPGAARPPGTAAAIISLSPSTDTGDKGDGVTSNLNPAVDVQGAAAGVTLHLLRDDDPVKTVSTGLTPPPVISIRDDESGQLTPGSYVYKVVQVNPDGTQVELGQVGVTIAAPRVAAIPPAATTAAVATSDLMQRFVSQFGALATPTAAATAAPVTAPAVVPVAAGPPSAGNQVTLNQYFGRTKVLGPPVAAAEHKRFSLFHRKEKARPVIRTFDVAGVDAAATSVAGVTAVAQGTAAQPPRFTPEASAKSVAAAPAAAGSVVVPPAGTP